jgi:hypothetical protein
VDENSSNGVVDTLLSTTGITDVTAREDLGDKLKTIASRAFATMMNPDDYAKLFGGEDNALFKKANKEGTLANSAYQVSMIKGIQNAITAGKIDATEGAKMITSLGTVDATTGEITALNDNAGVSNILQQASYKITGLDQPQLIQAYGSQSLEGVARQQIAAEREKRTQTVFGNANIGKDTMGRAAEAFQKSGGDLGAVMQAFIGLQDTSGTSEAMKKYNKAEDAYGNVKGNIQILEEKKAGIERDNSSASDADRAAAVANVDADIAKEKSKLPGLKKTVDDERIAAGKALEGHTFKDEQRRTWKDIIEDTSLYGAANLKKVSADASEIKEIDSQINAIDEKIKGSTGADKTKLEGERDELLKKRKAAQEVFDEGLKSTKTRREGDDGGWEVYDKDKNEWVKDETAVSFAVNDDGRSYAYRGEQGKLQIQGRDGKWRDANEGEKSRHAANAQAGRRIGGEKIMNGEDDTGFMKTADGKVFMQSKDGQLIYLDTNEEDLKKGLTGGKKADALVKESGLRVKDEEGMKAYEAQKTALDKRKDALDKKGVKITDKGAEYTGADEAIKKEVEQYNKDNEEFVKNREDIRVKKGDTIELQKVDPNAHVQSELGAAIKDGFQSIGKVELKTDSLVLHVDNMAVTNGRLAITAESEDMTATPNGAKVKK